MAALMSLVTEKPEEAEDAALPACLEGSLGEGSAAAFVLRACSVFPQSCRGIMLLDDPQIGSHEVLSAQGNISSVCRICFPLFSRNVTSEYQPGSPAAVRLRASGPGHRVPGNQQWN